MSIQGLSGGSITPPGGPGALRDARSRAPKVEPATENSRQGRREPETRDAEIRRPSVEPPRVPVTTEADRRARERAEEQARQLQRAAEERVAASMRKAQLTSSARLKAAAQRPSNPVTAENSGGVDVTA